MNNLIRLVLACLKAEEGINILIKSLEEIFLEFFFFRSPSLCLFLKAREAVKKFQVTPPKASSGWCGLDEPILCLQQTESSHLTHCKFIQLLMIIFYSYFEEQQLCIFSLLMARERVYK